MTPHHHHTIQVHRDERSTTLAGLARPAMIGAAAVGIVGLVVAAGLAAAEGDHFRRFLFSYLTSYAFFLSLSLGGLFFVLVQHASHAGWSVTVRRLAEVPAANVGVLAVLFLPILLPLVVAGNDSLYIWADAKELAANPVIRSKAQWWLNPGFFGIRFVLYFAIWFLLGQYYYRRSLAQDHSAAGGPAITRDLQRFSPVALLLYAVTVTLASFDLLMSLTPDWYSTIYGLYYFSGAAVAIMAWIIVAAMLLRASGRLRGWITTEHYHDLGKLLFGFVVFWGYIAFSQYMLIWYANIPEETQWYQPRSHGPWAQVSLALLFGNLLLPFAGLLSRWMKRWRAPLLFWAAWLLVMHWVDIYWLVMPAFDPRLPRFGAIDIACLVGIGGCYLAGIFYVAGERPLVPLADPRLDESLAFENA